MGEDCIHLTLEIFFMKGIAALACEKANLGLENQFYLLV